MTFKNSMKILLTNFSLVWKVLLFLSLCTMVLGTLVYLTLKSVVMLLLDSGVLNVFIDSYSAFLTDLNFTLFLQDIGDGVVMLGDWFKSVFPRIWINILLFVLLIVIFRSIIYNLAYMPITNKINYYMGSMTKYPFINSFVSTFGLNLKYQLVYTFTLLPIKLLSTYAIVKMFRLFTINGLFPLVSLFLIILAFTLISVIRVCLFNVWIPAMVVFNNGVFSALFRGIKISIRKFWTTFSNSTILVLTILVVNVMAGLATVGVALLVTIPASYILYSIFGLVVLYDAQGMKYYVDSYNVVVPRKKDTTEKISTVKYII